MKDDEEVVMRALQEDTSFLTQYSRMGAKDMEATLKYWKFAYHHASKRLQEDPTIRAEYEKQQELFQQLSLREGNTSAGSHGNVGSTCTFRDPMELVSKDQILEVPDFFKDRRPVFPQVNQACEDKVLRIPRVYVPQFPQVPQLGQVQHSNLNIFGSQRNNK